MTNSMHFYFIYDINNNEKHMQWQSYKVLIKLYFKYFVLLSLLNDFHIRELLLQLMVNKCFKIKSMKVNFYLIKN